MGCSCSTNKDGPCTKPNLKKERDSNSIENTKHEQAMLMLQNHRNKHYNKLNKAVLIGFAQQFQQRTVDYSLKQQMDSK